MKNFIMGNIELFFIVIFCFFYIGCETSAPEIVDVEWQINVFEQKDTGQFEENLVFFIFAEDEDGKEDLKSIYLLHDESEQYWALSQENWTSSSSLSENWIGSSNIMMPDGSPIPRGDYRVLLYDAAGQKAEREITIDTVVIDPKTLEFPKISVVDGTVELESKLKNVMAVFYDRNDRFISSSMIEFDKTALDRFPRSRELTKISKNRLFLYVWDSEKGYGLISGPIVGLYDDAKKK